MAQNRKIKIIVAGAAGRMGKAILNLAVQDPELEIAGAFERKGHAQAGCDIGELIGCPAMKLVLEDDYQKCVSRGHVLIDFTLADAVSQNVQTALSAKQAMVVGTTGLSQETLDKLRTASHTIPIVQAPNMSVGVHVLFRLVSLAGQVLDDHYDVEIIEEHHRHKKDAPSGTALELARVIAEARKIRLEEQAVYGRKGMTGERARGTVGINAVRGGDTIGVHDVCFISEGERIELIHKASSRDAFAFGALKAAKFLSNKTNGYFNMQQVLGLA